MEWISVKDRLPEKDDFILVYGDCNSTLSSDSIKKTIGLVCFETTDYSSCIDTCYYDVWYFNITHWMPLPEPPKEQ